MNTKAIKIISLLLITLTLLGVLLPEQNAPSSFYPVMPLEDFELEENVTD